MGCGGCQKELDALRAELVELKATLAALFEDYLKLARLYDLDQGTEETEEIGEG